MHRPFVILAPMLDRRSKLAATLIAILILVSGLGEASLPLFGGDRVLAARVMKSLYTLLAGIAFALIQPIVWTSFARLLQSTIKRGRLDSTFTRIVLGHNFAQRIHKFALVLAVAIGIATVTLALALWIYGNP